MRTDVLIIGAGPVGLDLAIRLVLKGLTVRMLERRSSPTDHSRSIGIHPPALEALAETGVAERLIPHGVSVHEGIALTDSGPIGRLAFDRCPPPYRFILAIPQWRTEQVLEKRLSEVALGSLIRDTEVISVHQDDQGVAAMARSGEQYEARWMVGCDGKQSTVRRDLGIDFPGRTYPDHYVMGDFRDESGIGPKAAVYLTRHGLVESFPLPDGMRRWVVRTPRPWHDPLPADVAQLATDRTGVDLDPSTATMTSSFGVQRHLAETMAQGRILLAGDAAHVVSPIGGQGMNLGWLDGRDAAAAIEGASKNHANRARLFWAYSARRRQAATRAAGRAEFNMAFGRPSAWMPAKQAAARLILSPPFSGIFARRFTMRGLEAA